MIRPQRGSRAMSTIGAKVQWMPDRAGLPGRNRLAAVRSPCGSQDAAIAIGTGKIVRRPWITSKPNSAGYAVPVALDGAPLQRVDLSGGVGENSIDPTSPRPVPPRPAGASEVGTGNPRRRSLVLTRSRSTGSVAPPSRPLSSRQRARRSFGSWRPRRPLLTPPGGCRHCRRGDAP